MFPLKSQEEEVGQTEIALRNHRSKHEIEGNDTPLTREPKLTTLDITGLSDATHLQPISKSLR